MISETHWQTSLSSLAAQLEAIGDTRDRLCRQISDLQDQINTLQCQVDGYDEQSRTIQLEYNSICNRTAAVSTLPNEVLAIIFKTAHLSQGSKYRTEVTISHVTRRWRHVALATPRLWTTIHRAMCESFDRLETYLQRSDPILFDLTIMIGNKRGLKHVENDATISTLYLSIALHMGRCRRLNISSQSRDIMLPLLDCLSSLSAPALQDLNISSMRPMQDRHRDGSVRHLVSGGAPSLTTVVLRRMGPHFCFPPMVAVTALRIYNYSPSSEAEFYTLRDVLRDMMSLTQLELQGVVDKTATPVGLNLALPALQLLAVHSTTSHSQQKTFDLLMAINAPLLQTLHLKHKGIFFLEGSPAPNTSPRFPLLRRLTIISESSPEALDFPDAIRITQLRKIPQYFASIVDFTCGRNSDDMIAILREVDRVAPSHLAIWPHLHTLRFKTPVVSRDNIQKLLVQRSNMECPIHRLLLHKDSFGDNLALDEWRKNLREYVQLEEYRAEFPRPFSTYD